MKSIVSGIALLFCTVAVAQNGFMTPFKPGLTTTNLHLQSPKDKAKYLDSDRDGRALSFLYADFKHDLNTYLDSTTSSHGDLLQNYMGIGIDQIGKSDEYAWLDVVTGFTYILPQKVNAGMNDSLQLKLYGWHYTMSWFGVDVIPGDIVTLAIAPSWAYGNLKIRRTEFGQKTKYTNPFVAPGARAEFRLTFGNFMIGGRATYRYDITHARWKRKDNMMPVLPEYKNNGLAYFGYIGLIF